MMKWKWLSGITSILCVAVLLTTSAIAATVANGRDEGHYEALVLRNAGESLSADEIERIRGDVLARARAKGRLGHRSEGVYVLADLSATNQADIVAFGFIVRPDGVPSGFVAMANRGEPVAGIHEQAREWLLRERRVRASGEVSQPNDTTKQDCGDISSAAITSVAASAHWVQVGSQRVHTMNHRPYGQYTNHASLFRLNNDGSATHDFFAVRQWAATTPGRLVAYNSNWVNVMQTPQHDWGWGQLSAEMIDRDPFGTVSGSQSVGVSLDVSKVGPAATLGWSYTQPNVTTRDTSVLVPPLARWQQEFNTYASQTTSGGMEPGSAARTIAPAPGVYNLVAVRNVVRYRDPRVLWDEFREFSHVIGFWVVY